jgi:hypothetical protein
MSSGVTRDIQLKKHTNGQNQKALGLLLVYATHIQNVDTGSDQYLFTAKLSKTKRVHTCSLGLQEASERPYRDC